MLSVPQEFLEGTHFRTLSDFVSVVPLGSFCVGDIVSGCSSILNCVLGRPVPCSAVDEGVRRALKLKTSTRSASGQRALAPLLIVKVLCGLI